MALPSNSPATRRLPPRWAYSVPALDVDQERKVVRRWQRRGDREVLRTLVEANMRHAVSIAPG